MKITEIHHNILIYGSGDAGIQSVNVLKLSKISKIIGFIDDDQSKIGKKIDNYQIFSFESIPMLKQKYNVTKIIICIPSLGLNKKKKLIGKLEKYKLEILSLPKLEDLYTGKVSINDFKTLNINDLIDREIVVSKSLILNKIKDKVIFITGAGGSIGSELSKQIIKYNPKKIILLDNSEINIFMLSRALSILKKKFNSVEIIFLLVSIQDVGRLRYFFELYKPEIVFHAAAYKHVNILEYSIVEAINNNVLGTLNLVELSVEFKIKNFVLISSDKAVRPINIMGVTKRISEMILQSYASKNELNNDVDFAIVRFGNVIGSSGSVTPLFLEQIKNGGPITVTHKEVTRYFMSVYEAASLVIETILLSKGGELFILDMGEPIKIVDLAKKMIKLSGLTEKNNSNPNGDIEIIYIGLQPGEKLHEELLLGDNLVKTNNINIFKSKDKYIDLNELNEFLIKLKFSTKNYNENEIISLIKNYVKEFNYQIN